MCVCAGSVKSGQQQHGEGNAAAGMMIDMLECTLWQRQLGSLPEETVSALVAQVSVDAERATMCLQPISEMSLVDCRPAGAD